VGFIYNKDLMAKGGVDGAAIKTWDDLLAAVRKLKAAGVTPITVGGGDKWPLHFYWTNLAVRQGGKAAFDAALQGKDGGFEGETYQKAGEYMKQLVDLQPFQNGFLGFKNPQATDYVGVPDDKLGFFDFPTVPGGKGAASDTLGGINGWLITKGAPKAAVDFVKHFVSKDVQARLAGANFLIPVVKGADAGIGNAFMRNVAQNLARSGYHQNFYDQDLGPSVGRVVNDATAELAGGSMTPRQVAKAVQDAWKQGN